MAHHNSHSPRVRFAGPEHPDPNPDPNPTTTMPSAAEPLLLKRRAVYARCASRSDDELRSFRSLLRWMCVDQSAAWSAAVSWAVFFLLAVVVPLGSHFVLLYNDHRRSYDTVVEISLTSVAALSFLCLSGFVKRYGLRRFLFLDKLCGDSQKVCLGYTAQLHGSFRLLSSFVLPCFAAETAYKIWWYYKGVGRIPLIFGNPIASDIFTCILELCSWLYRTSIFFLVCVLFRLICHLQILRLQDFAAVFHDQSDVASILSDHLRIRRQLRVISHRFRMFILCTLMLVTISQLASLLLTTRPHADVNFFNTGETALCSIGLLTGLMICLRSAAKITHKAQAITSQAAKWHVNATVESFDTDPETPETRTADQKVTSRDFSALLNSLNNPSESSEDDIGDDDEDTTLWQPHANTISFQKRQALVTYLENNKAGITVYGFMLDRSWLHMIFGVELALVLWLLGKTIGVS